MIIVIDNYDSFTYNLVQYMGEILIADGKDPEKLIQVYRNDEISLDDLSLLKPTHIVISPGPCTPNEAGISVELIKEFKGKIPTLGVCLGHQSIGQAFGGEIIQADKIMHGKTSLIHHEGRSVFKGLESPFQATRYHSLVINPKNFPDDELEITAHTEEGEIMGVKHKKYDIHGVQFHPESILTFVGKKILGNFLGIDPFKDEEGI
jgi:anthranilate synthase/aminodeoxychorismate synthase-like glutamine amidotransferase